MIRALFLALLAYVAVAQNSSSSSDAGSSSSSDAAAATGNATSSSAAAAGSSSSSAAATTYSDTAKTVAVTTEVKASQLEQFVDLQLIVVASQYAAANAAVTGTPSSLLPACPASGTPTATCVTIPAPTLGSSISGNLNYCGIAWNTTTLLYGFDGDCSSRRVLQEDSAPQRRLSDALKVSSDVTIKSTTTPATITTGDVATAYGDIKTQLASNADYKGVAFADITAGSTDFKATAANVTASVTAAVTDQSAGGGAASTSGASTMMLSAGALAGAAFLMF